MVNDDVEVGREVNLKAISSEYGGDLLEKKGKIYGKEKAEDDKEQPQVVDKEEVQELILMESEVDVTLKKMYTLTDEDNNKIAFKMACQMNLLHAPLDKVIDVYIKALNQYFDTQHRAHSDKEKIVLADVFACQYIGKAFNVWTHNMFSPEVDLVTVWRVGEGKVRKYLNLSKPVVSSCGAEGNGVYQFVGEGIIIRSEDKDGLAGWASRDFAERKKCL
ncbi:hypothetical protein GIB67_040592 [Kingdonia uniflora]|uniref:Uncharacterized protein n=1 Tax=Kingdonia uniflora TaxID=39325 RepID=A0A7J7M8W1_9MAGN|nr:hypothetical protein GIB67_040592 [Kingdonia uniflora]